MSNEIDPAKQQELDAWLAVVEHQAKKHLTTRGHSADLHKILVAACQQLEAAKRYAREGDLDLARETILQAVGLAIGGAAARIEPPRLHMLTLAQDSKRHVASCN